MTGASASFIEIAFKTVQPRLPVMMCENIWAVIPATFATCLYFIPERFTNSTTLSFNLLISFDCEVNPKGWMGQLISHYETGRTIPSTLRMRMIVEALNKLGAECTLDQVFPPPVDLAA